MLLVLVNLGELRCPDFLLTVYPSLDDELQCQWSAKQVTKLLCPGEDTDERRDEKLRKFWNKNEKVILDMHAEIWPGSQPRLLRPPKDTTKKPEHDDKDPGKLLDEKVLPTTVFIASLIWGIAGKRRDPGNRQLCCQCLSILVDACCRAGGFHVKFFCMTDLPPPGAVPVDMKMETSECPLRLLVAPETWEHVEKVWNDEMQDSFSAYGYFEDVGEITCWAILTGDDRLDALTTEASDVKQKKSASGKTLTSLSMTRRFEIVKMVTYLGKALRIFGDEPHLHVAFDGSSIGGTPVELYKFHRKLEGMKQYKRVTVSFDYHWSMLQRAFGGIKQSWYATQQVVPETVLAEKEHKCHQLLRDNMLWCSKVLGRMEDPCMFGNVLDIYPEFRDEGSVAEKQQLLFNCRRTPSCFCKIHGVGASAPTACRIPSSHFDVSGLPCPDFSTAGKRRRAEGPTNSVFLAHGRMHGELQTPLLLIENVQALDMQMVQQTHPDYEWYQIFTEPGELGFTATSRARTYIIGAHKTKCVCLHDPFELHDAIKSRIADYARTAVSDYLVASDQEILMEAQDTGRTRNVVHRPGVQDYAYYLTQRELRSMGILDQKYREKFGREPHLDGNLVYHLGDNAEWTTNWSANSGALPTFRLGAATSKFWLPRYRRWLTCREKLVAMGFPVTAECAHALGTPVVFVSDVRRAADILGNCMHFTTAGVMTNHALVSLGCCVTVEIYVLQMHSLVAEFIVSSTRTASKSGFCYVEVGCLAQARLTEIVGFADDALSLRSDPPAEKDPPEDTASCSFSGRSSNYAEPRSCGCECPAAAEPLDSTLREYMEASEPIKAGRSFTNKLGSKVIRLAFYGMYRKMPTDRGVVLELRSDKRTQMAQLKNEYLRLGQPMHDCSLLDLVRRVEIEFSKDKAFEVGGGNSWLVLCGDQFRKLPEPQSGSWEVKIDPGTQLPFLNDDGFSMMWAISPFQSKEQDRDYLPKLDLAKNTPVYRHPLLSSLCATARWSADTVEYAGADSFRNP
ncbi:desi2 [Symbiodinium necroappetens]|uniref:Desi2 protein n=1 Tax=Symbiodinium necroappetens TaxID=1628268 RepID=A0A812MWF0_9DINO|nr:desi2 [Symbiodinium necroappetens]